MARNAPRDWQDLFASEMAKNDFRRLKSDGNIDVDRALFVVVADAGDLMAFEKPTTSRTPARSCTSASS